MTTTGTHNCNDFKAPSSLKDLLDFYAKLDATNGQSDFTNAVLQDLKKRLTGDGKGWIRNGTSPKTGNDGADWFYNNGNSNGTGCVMPKTIKGLKNLRDKILNGNGKNANNNYNLPDQDATSDPCIRKYADAIIQNAFPLFGCLFYLWFMCDNEANGAKTIKNGFTGWEDDYIDDSINLNKFLKDQQPDKNKNSVPMLRRGFPREEGKLKPGTKGQQLYQKGGDTDKLFSLNCSANSATGFLQQALFFLLFLAPRWHPAMSGHALLFLDWFKDNASQAPFNDVQWLHVKKAGEEYFNDCTQLSNAIKGLGTGNNGKGPDIAPVHKDSISKNGNGNNRCNLYSPGTGGAHSGNGHEGATTILHNTSSFNGQNGNGHRRAHVFMQYVSWLWWCIPHLTASLKEMSADSSKWNKTKFENSTTFGPFPWGFTFTNGNWQNGTGASELQQKLQKLITAIEHFRDYHIGAFFWAIRRPFAYGSLAAWILSFTFLLYVNLLPLDLFHIQSHYNVFSFNKGPIRPLHEVSYFSGA